MFYFELDFTTILWHFLCLTCIHMIFDCLNQFLSTSNFSNLFEKDYEIQDARHFEMCDVILALCNAMEQFCSFYIYVPYKFDLSSETEKIATAQ